MLPNPQYFTPSLRTFSTPLSKTDKVGFKIQSNPAGFILTFMLKKLPVNPVCGFKLIVT